MLTFIHMRAEKCISKYALLDLNKNGRGGELGNKGAAPSKQNDNNAAIKYGTQCIYSAEHAPCEHVESRLGMVEASWPWVRRK